MSTITRSIAQIFRGSSRALETFPASILNALAFTIVTLIRIRLDWPQQEPYNFLFNCLHWSFALGAIFSLAAITAAQSRHNTKSAFITANVLGIAASALAFILLFFMNGNDSVSNGSRFEVLSILAETRVGVAIFISFLAFVILAGYPKEQSDFSRSLFMVHKAFFIALIYGIVIFAGASGVAGAVQALLYQNMSSKVYMVIGTIAGFIAYTIFAGYFPDFRKGNRDEHRDIAQKQPKFIEILFGYIMVPLVLALTLVLLLWSGKTIINGMGSSFIRLYSIAAAYTIGGIWLHVMVAHHETGLARFYRRVYPIAALIILGFEAWALITQLGRTGLKMTEYYFGLLWILTVAAALLLILLKQKTYSTIAIITCVLAFVSVLPIVGAHALPVTAQVNRLEQLLIQEGMLEDNNLSPAVKEPDLKVKESVTDAVLYLGYANDANLPQWFDKSLVQSDVFSKKMGFEQTWPKSDDNFPPGGYYGTSLNLSQGTVDISDYQWATGLQEYYGKEGPILFEGNRGEYKIYWTINRDDGIPTLKILLDDRVVLEQDMNDYIDRITKKFPPGKSESYKPSIEDMSLKLETPEISVLLVFNNIDINLNPQEDIINYWFNPNALYLAEK